VSVRPALDHTGPHLQLLNNRPNHPFRAGQQKTPGGWPGAFPGGFLM